MTKQNWKAETLLWLSYQALKNKQTNKNNVNNNNNKTHHVETEKEPLCRPPCNCQTQEIANHPKNQRKESNPNKEHKSQTSQLQDKTGDGQDMQKLFLDHIKYTDSTNDALKMTAQI